MSDSHAHNESPDSRFDKASDEEKSIDTLPDAPETMPENKEQDIQDFRVKFDQNDPEDPQQWSTKYKVWITIQLGMLAIAGSLGSSIISPANETIARYVGVSDEVAVLNVSLYVLGFAAGPVIWAPLSEIWGRRISMLPALFCLGVFSIGTAVSKNAAAIFITRFFGGFFGSAPVSNVSAALGDIWSIEARGVAVSFYSVMVVGGPTLGPIIGSALVVGPGWRWTEYVQAIWTFAVVALAFFALPELYPLVLLKRKAQRLRKETGDSRWFHPHEEIKFDRAHAKTIVTKQLSRPLRMLFTEPIVTCIAFYAAFVYAVLYMTIEALPYEFETVRGWGPVVGSLPFLGMLVGIIISMGFNAYNSIRYTRISREAGGIPVPEARLPPMAVGGILFCAGLFWFAWTGSPRDHWILPVLSTALIGFGFNSIFQQSINFLIDTYTIYAASAVAAITFLRSLLAAGLSLAVDPMLEALGVGRGITIIAAVAAALMPVPFLFMKFGVRLRAMSKLTPDHKA